MQHAATNHVTPYHGARHRDIFFSADRHGVTQLVDSFASVFCDTAHEAEFSVARMARTSGSATPSSAQVQES
jgi:hypothetical protein